MDGCMDGWAGESATENVEREDWLRLVRLLTIVALSSPSSATSNRASSYEKLQLLSVPRSNAAAIIVPLAPDRGGSSHGFALSLAPSPVFLLHVCGARGSRTRWHTSKRLAERLARLRELDLPGPPGLGEGGLFRGMTRVFGMETFFFSKVRFSLLLFLVSIRRWICRLFFRVEDEGERSVRAEGDDSIDYRGDNGT